MSADFVGSASLLYSFYQITGGPKPPPPGVSIRTRSPARRSSEQTPGSGSGSQPARITQFRRYNVADPDDELWRPDQYDVNG